MPFKPTDLFLRTITRGARSKTKSTDLWLHPSGPEQGDGNTLADSGTSGSQASQSSGLELLIDSGVNVASAIQVAQATILDAGQSSASAAQSYIEVINDSGQASFSLQQTGDARLIDVGLSTSISSQLLGSETIGDSGTSSSAWDGAVGDELMETQGRGGGNGEEPPDLPMPPWASPPASHPRFRRFVPRARIDMLEQSVSTSVSAHTVLEVSCLVSVSARRALEIGLSSRASAWSCLELQVESYVSAEFQMVLSAPVRADVSLALQVDREEEELILLAELV